mmetsp:Transcript_20997/g.30253  ORF Transcript_20997/g.30253 Transcript_20997/m.30253 type:complete len:275 (+) Transcript_20997:280-1104(+)
MLYSVEVDVAEIASTLTSIRKKQIVCPHFTSKAQATVVCRISLVVTLRRPQNPCFSSPSKTLFLKETKMSQEAMLSVVLSSMEGPLFKVVAKQSKRISKEIFGETTSFLEKTITSDFPCCTRAVPLSLSKTIVSKATPGAEGSFLPTETLLQQPIIISTPLWPIPNATSLPATTQLKVIHSVLARVLVLLMLPLVKHVLQPQLPLHHLLLVLQVVDFAFQGMLWCKYKMENSSKWHLLRLEIKSWLKMESSQRFTVSLIGTRMQSQSISSLMSS